MRSLPARKNAGDDPIRKLGKTPMNDPKAKPSAVLPGVEIVLSIGIV